MLCLPHRGEAAPLKSLTIPLSAGTICGVATVRPSGALEEWGMTKSELIEAIAARSELTKARAEMVVNCVFDAMTQALQRGEGIEIRGFGSFTVRPYKPYDGRNPRTGQPVPVPAKRLPFFKVGKELKELVNASRERELEARRQAGEAGELPLRDDSDDDD